MKSIEVLAHRVLKNMDTGQEISIFSAVPPGNWEPVTKGYTWETVSNSGSVRRGLGRQAAYEAMKARENTFMEKFLEPANPTPVVEGEVIKNYMECGVSKVGNLGEALDSMFTDGRRYAGDAKIVKVLTVSNEKYEAFVRNSLGNDGDFEFAVEPGSDTTIGGSESNDPRLEALVPHSDEYMKIYRESMVQLVHAVVSPNRRTIYINSHGYNYARYIGIDSNTVL